MSLKNGSATKQIWPFLPVDRGDRGKDMVWPLAVLAYAVFLIVRRAKCLKAPGFVVVPSERLGWSLTISWPVGGRGILGGWKFRFVKTVGA